MSTYVEDIDSAFVHEEALEQTLDDDQAFAQEQHDRSRPGTPSMEYNEEQVLGPEDQEKEDRIYKERYDGQGYQASVEQRIEFRMS